MEVKICGVLGEIEKASESRFRDSKIFGMHPIE